MCGIVAVLARPSGRPAPAIGPVVEALVEARATIDEGTSRLERDPAASLAAFALAAGILEETDRALRGVAGVAGLLAGPDTAGLDAGGLDGAGLDAAGLDAAGLDAAGLDAVAGAADLVGGRLAALEADLDRGAVTTSPEDQEALNAALVRLKDAWWAIARDRVGGARAVADLAGGAACDRPGPPARHTLAGYWAIQVVLASIDRLEVRGRDSAGVHVLVAGHGLDVDSHELQALLGARASDPLFTSLGVRTPPGCLSLVYKAAAEIGELGDNVAALRTAVRSDPLLALALDQPGARVTVIGHTRWASVGIISQANAHPLNSDELDRRDGPYVVGALNGDVDNYLDLRLSESLALPAEVTTDAKVIPTLVSHRIAAGDTVEDAFARTVARFEGSVAIAVSAAETPDRLYLALRGSGQSLNVGFAEDAFVVASEAYGLVEETWGYLRLDGEVTRGQTVVLDRAGAGTIAGMRAATYAGAPISLAADDVVVPAITTRDIDRAGFPHFLLKEIGEAPSSFRKTLRGRIVAEDGRLTVRLAEDALPRAVIDEVASGRVRRILVIGQGTAAIAGQAVAAAFSRLLPATVASAVPATELSGFGLTDDMSDTLVVAISQSGTTTDTNRTVDLCRGRGAHVIGVVNRRNSDLVAKSHGVLYTSDGRDVEMSVASTKAFYAQVAAGWVLAAGLAAGVGTLDPAEADRILQGLRDLPDAMEQVLAIRPEIARVAAAVGPPRRYWALVGSGPDRVAAEEIRIKLSELCYKAIACDATEDKKHIDLSSEPLILVCAGGLSGPNADDVAKEVAIYRAHKAAPVVIAAAGEAARFDAALEVIEVPAFAPDLAFVLSAMVGHLFGYEAALAIDAQARPLRAARAAFEALAVAGGDGPATLERLAPRLRDATRPFLDGVRAGAYNGHLEAATAVRLVSLLRYATGDLPLEAYEVESGKVGSPSVLVADLLDALSAGIDELTRPVDAIKHQAKTVTVGISRSEDALLTKLLVKETLAAGATADLLGYRALRTLAALDPAVEAVLGYTRYRIEPAPPGRGRTVPGSLHATIAVVDQGGLAARLPSRTTRDPRLRGTKHRAADEREVTVALGRSDNRTVVLVPESKGSQVTGMTLLHVQFAERLPAGRAREVLSGYRGRYSALSDAVTETEPTFDDEVLATVPLVQLLTDPVYVLAERWRRPDPVG